MRAVLLSIAALTGVGCVPSPSTTIQPVSASNALYMPRTIQQAYRKGTRSYDGRPGPNYWQNRGRYNISISATPPDRTIRGS
ncbi:MAG TPA: hypothetical protein VGD02_09025, partial [Gemmatimonadaceae bacterium]